MDGEHNGALLRGALGQILLREFDSREDCLERRERHGVTENDADGVEALVEAVEKLCGEVHLRDDVIDVGKAGDEQLHASRVLINREVPLLEVAVLVIEGHVLSGAICEKIVSDPVPEIIGCGGTGHMVNDGIGKGGIHGQGNMGIELTVLGVRVGWRGVLDEVGDAVANENHEKERFPFMIVVIGRVQEKLEVGGDVGVEDEVTSSRGRRRWGRRRQGE